MYFNGTTFDIGVPLVVKILITAVKIMMRIRGFKPLKVYFKGTPDITTAIMVNKVMAINVQTEFTINITAINATDKRIFVLGSAL
jgi:hypothetical protein